MSVDNKNFLGRDNFDFSNCSDCELLEILEKVNAKEDALIEKTKSFIEQMKRDAEDLKIYDTEIRELDILEDAASELIELESENLKDEFQVIRKQERTSYNTFALTQTIGFIVLAALPLILESLSKYYYS